MKILYLLVNFFTVFIPVIYSFHPKIKFYKTWKSFFIAAFIIALVFALWDAVFTHLGVWSFNPRYVTGIYILKLPVEEWLFFICIPFSCVFTYYCLDRFYNLAWNKGAEKLFGLVLSVLLLTTSIFFYNRLYTSATFISTAIICLTLLFVLKIQWFGKAVTVYALLLIPFLIVNGILTGSGLSEPVVRYNSLENMGIRLFTIPVEDVFYGFELFLLNLFLYLQLQSKRNTATSENIHHTPKQIISKRVYNEKNITSS